MTVLGYTANDSFLALVDLVAASSPQEDNNNYNLSELEIASARKSLLSLNVNDTIGSRQGNELAQWFKNNKQQSRFHEEREDRSTIREPSYWKGGDDWITYEYSIQLKSTIMDVNDVNDVKGNIRVSKKNKSQNPIFHVPSQNGHRRVEPATKEGKENNDCGEGKSQLLRHHCSVGKRKGGIIKRSSMVVPICLGLRQAEKRTFSPKTFLNRPSNPSFKKKVRFAFTIRILPIQSLRTMAIDDKNNYWWKTEDFHHFKKEICLLANPKEDEAKASSLLLLELLNPPENNSDCSSSLAQYNNNVNATNSSHRRKESSDDEKEWWHKYGDSRRGLEKFAHSSEHRQIMDSCALAIRMVLAEQRFQHCEQDRCCFVSSPMNTNHKEGVYTKRLAQIYQDYAAWSKDLALAAAASDEDAVQTDFDDSKRKTREFYLLKQYFRNGKGVHKHMPQFMLPQCCTAGNN